MGRVKRVPPMIDMESGDSLHSAQPYGSKLRSCLTNDSWSSAATVFRRELRGGPAGGRRGSARHQPFARGRGGLPAVPLDAARPLHLPAVGPQSRSGQARCGAPRIPARLRGELRRPGDGRPELAESRALVPDQHHRHDPPARAAAEVQVPQEIRAGVHARGIRQRPAA